MTRRILLADDSPTIQRLVEQTFQGGEFDIVSVSNGDAAVRKFEEIRPSAVLADVFMPGKNGYEVCAVVKAHSTLSRTPVILLVGAFEAFDAREAKSVGADGKISKPFEPQELLGLISSLVEPDTSAPEDPDPAPPKASDSNSEPIGQESADSQADILGLRQLFPAISRPAERPALSEAELEAIADRVIERLSAEVIEGIAWEIVPDVAEKVVREEMKRRE